MDHEIQLISDGDGLAVIGEPASVERFLVSEGVPSRNLARAGLGDVLGVGSATAKAGSQLVANSGRWVKLTPESSQLVKKYGLRESSMSGLSTGVVKGSKGQIKGFVEFSKRPGSVLTNPAILAGAAGIMAQVAMQQTMDEITDYLAAIDEKVDDVLRAQKDGVLADMIGVDFVIEEAMTIRGEVGRVSEVTWSKVQSTSTTIARTQAYALRQLDALAEKLENKGDFGDLAKAARKAESTAQEWLAVLAHCFQLQEALGVLELDRVLDASPDELDRHRLGLKSARQNRLELLAGNTERLMARMDAAAGTANAKVLMHPTRAPAIVRSSNHVSSAILAFEQPLGIERERQSSDTRRWTDAAADARNSALEVAADGLDGARRFGVGSLSRVKAVGGRVPRRRAKRDADRDPAADETATEE
jgi:hypothetical protein